MQTKKRWLVFKAAALISESTQKYLLVTSCCYRPHPKQHPNSYNPFGVNVWNSAVKRLEGVKVIMCHYSL